jgi:PLP dependent protein
LDQVDGAFMTTQIEENYNNVIERIQRAAELIGRNPETIKLVVVTKGQTLEKIQNVVSAGARMLGENYIEEAIPKIDAFSSLPGLEWRMIGHLQSRKVSQVCEYFNFLDTLDSVKLARRANQSALDKGRVLPVLLECNVSGETSKSGWPAWDEENRGALAEQISEVIELKNIRVQGLMTIPPFFSLSEQTRPFFRRLKRLCDYFGDQFPQIDWRELSMGMSGDYEIAIQEGATMVRVGTAIMGSREQ